MNRLNRLAVGMVALVALVAFSSCSVPQPGSTTTTSEVSTTMPFDEHQRCMVERDTLDTAILAYLLSTDSLPGSIADLIEATYVRDNMEFTWTIVPAENPFDFELVGPC